MIQVEGLHCWFTLLVFQVEEIRCPRLVGGDGDRVEGRRGLAGERRKEEENILINVLHESIESSIFDYSINQKNQL